MNMSPAFSIALLLLSATVVKSWKSLEVQTEEEEGFTPQLKLDVGSADHHPEEILQDGAFPGSCKACEFIVSKVKKKLGSDHSKEKIGQLLDNICNQMKCVIKSACKKIIRKFKNKLIDAIANNGLPRSVCVKLKLCKRNTPVYRYYI